MNKHTPGPWAIDDLTVYALNGNQNQGNRFWAMVCRGRDDNHYRIEASEARANASLIAAAPCMYSLLAVRAESGDNDARELIERINNG